MKRVLVVIGILTVAYHTLAFVMGVIEGLRPGTFVTYPNPRLVWSRS
jgi:hypothetical protein